MPAQRDPGTYSVPKKKKPPPAAPSVETVNAVEGGKGVKQAHQAAVAKPSGTTTPAATLGGSEVTQSHKAATESQKQLKKKYPEILSHKQIKENKAYEGAKKPKTKGERQAKAKGKAIADILNTKPSPSLERFRQSPTDQIRVAQINNLTQRKHELKKNLKTEPGRQVSGAVAQANIQKVQTQLSETETELAKLKRDHYKAAADKANKNSTKIANLIGDPKYDQKKVVGALVQQEKGVAELRQKQQQLDKKRISHLSKTKYLKDQEQQRLQGIPSILKSAASDPTDLQEAGIRQRGTYENAQVKIPGIPGWQSFNAAKPSGALEDAANMAQWFPVGGAAVGTLLKAGKVGFESTVAGRAAIQGLEKVATPLREGTANLSSRALRGIAGATPRSVRTAAATAAARASIQRGTAKLIKQVASERGGTLAQTGSVIENSAKYADVHSSRHAFEIGSAIDDALMAGARKVIDTIPSDVSGYRTAGVNILRKGAKGGAFLGAFAIAPQVIQGKSLPDAASTVYRDAYDFVVGVVPSTYQVAAAGYEAIHGDWDRANQLKDAFLNYDPVGLAFQGKWQEALDAYNARPFTTSLELAGVEYALGRTIGATARRLPSQSIREAASLGPNIKQLGPLDTKATSLDLYSPDVFRKALKKGSEAATQKLAPKIAASLEKHDALHRITQRIDSMNGIKGSAQLRKFQENLNVHRQYYQAADAIGGDAAANALPFMITRIMRNPENAVGDLTRYRDKLLSRYNKRKTSKSAKVQDQQIYTHETIRVINEILDKPEMLGNQKLWDIADQYGKYEDARQEALVQNSSLDPLQAKAASWIPYVTHHLDGVRKNNGTWEINSPKIESAYSNVQYVSTSELAPYAEFDRRPGAMVQPKHGGKFGKKELSGYKTKAEWQAFKSEVGQKGITNEIILEYNPDTGKAWIGEGNHRIAAAVDLGIDQVPVRVVRTGKKTPYNSVKVKKNVVPNKHNYVPGDLKPSEVGFKEVPPRKTLDLSKPNDLEYIKNHAAAEGVAEPSFFRLHALNEITIPEAKNFNARGMQFQARTHKSLMAGTFDPTFKALFSHSMRVDHSIIDGDFAIQMANEFTPFRRHPETGEILYHGTTPENFASIQEHGFNTDQVFLTDSVPEAAAYAKWEPKLKDSKQNVIAARVDLKNPIIYHNSGKIEPRGAPYIGKDTNSKYNTEQIALARQQGFDGIVHYTDTGYKVAQVFDPAAIKEIYPSLDKAPEIVKSLQKGSVPLLGTKTQIENRLFEHGLTKDYVAFDLDVFRERLASLRGLGEATATSADRLQATAAGALGDALKAGENSALDGPRFIAMPKAVIQRMHAHAKVDDWFYRNQAGKMVRKTNSVFKGAVLPFNPHWGLGNVVDMTFRMMMDQSGGPAQWAYNWNRGRKALNHLKEVDPDAYWQEIDRMGHGFMTQGFEGIQNDRFISRTEKNVLREQYEVQRQMDGWQSTPQVKATQIQRSLGIAKGLSAYIPKAYKMLQEYNPAGFKWQQLIEKNVRQSAYGKADGELLKAIQKKFEESTLITPNVIEDTTLMRANSDVAHALAERVNGVLGDYSRMSPAMRFAVMSYAPFALWLRASVNWVLTLPAKHPMQTAVLASVSAMTERQRQELGLSELHPVAPSEAAGKAGVTKEQLTKPSFLQGSLDLGGSLYPTGTLTSFGTFSDPGVGGLSSFLLPQIQSTMLAGKFGLDWTGKELVYPDGRVPNPWERTGIALSSLSETFFPAFRWWKIIQADGAPDETATWWNPKPQGLRNTYVNPAIPSARYEDPKQSPLKEIFSPFKVVPSTYPPNTKLPPATEGQPAYNLGVQERAKTLKDGNVAPYIQSDTSAPPADKPWLKATSTGTPATTTTKKPWLK